jgi:hypothetical protein
VVGGDSDAQSAHARRFILAGMAAALQPDRIRLALALSGDRLRLMATGRAACSIRIAGNPGLFLFHLRYVYWFEDRACYCPRAVVCRER